MRKLSVAFIFYVQLSPTLGFADDIMIDRRIPNEYETVGGYGLGLGNNAVASVEGVAAVRVNPALLALDRTYAVGAGYNWPVAGRDFFQAGVVDSKSAPIAAGFSYTGFADDYSTEGEQYQEGSSRKKLAADAPIKRRAAVALAQTMGLLTAGIGGQFVEGYQVKDDFNAPSVVKGTAINFGIAGLLTPSLRVAASLENMANKKIAAFAPRTIRAGLSFFMTNDLTFNLDFRQRDRVELEQGFGDSFIDDNYSAAELEEARSDMDKENAAYKDPERMAFASGAARVYDNIRLLAAYGQTISGPVRKSLSGGVAVVSGNFSLSYSASRPYMSEPEAQQAVNAAFAINL